MFYAPDREPTVNLSVPLWHITGLDNFSIPRPASLGQNLTASPNSTGSGPGGQFLGSDFRAAYYGSGPLDGSGQSLGLLEFVGYNPADVTKYFSLYGPPLVTTVTPVSTDGSPATCTTCDDTEQALDIEVAISMAPAMDEVLVYVGRTDAAMLNRMATDNAAKSISCSWSWRPADPSTDDPIFLEFAAQGQTFFTASGDSGAWGPGTLFSWPADDQNVVSVGGTHLVTNGAGGPWQSETAWSDSGGGISLNGVAIPNYQMNKKVVNSTNGASRTLRNAPDVAAEGDFDNWICYDGTCGGGWGGTSFAAPRWAGLVALANQQAVLNGNPTVGFINPLLYKIAERTGYARNFHDITSGSNGGFNAVTNFDLVTGWGSPIGPTLIRSLTR
jgi:subtilase family serine protease